MKSIIYLLFLLIAPSIQAEIFKCTAKDGNTFYQYEECSETTKAEVVEIKPFDQNKYEVARKRLAEDLKRQAEYEDMEAHRALKERVVEELDAKAIVYMLDAILQE